VTSANDVAELIRSVRTGAMLLDANTHTVFTYTLHQLPVRSHIRSAGTASNDAASARLSSFSIITLANMSNGTKPNPSPWMKSLHAVLQRLEARSPAAPFHTSRACLVLRDALTGRTHAAFVGCISAAIEAAPYSYATLAFLSRLRLVVRLFEGLDPSTRVLPAGVSASDAPTPIVPRRPGQAAAKHESGLLFSAASAKADAADDLFGVGHDSLVGVESAFTSQREHSLRYDQDNTSFLEPLDAHVLVGGTSFDAAPSFRDDEVSTQSRSLFSHALVADAPDTHANPLSAAEEMATAMAARAAAGDETAKWFTALFSALEASRHESRQLRQRMDLLQRELMAVSSERDELRRVQPQLPAQTLEATESLLKDVRARLRASQQEVKDYELYKDVMETAVCRMQVCSQTRVVVCIALVQN
jgi:hypothetical protein